MNMPAAAMAAALAGGILLGMAPSVSHHYGSCRFVAELSGATFSLLILICGCLARICVACGRIVVDWR